jgi:hypothetical protein
MHVVIAEIAAGAAEITATAAAEGGANENKYKSRERPNPGAFSVPIESERGSGLLF